MRSCVCIVGALLVGASAGMSAGTAATVLVRVSDQAGLTAALKTVRPGTVIEIAPGTYRRIALRDVSGTADSPIVIRGANPERPPALTGTGTSVTLTGCAYVKLEGLRIAGFKERGIRIDDGRPRDTRSHHIVLDHLAITAAGSEPNHDALELAGVDHFVVRHCRFDGWDGAAIDVVGCHSGLIEDCRFFGRADRRQRRGIQVRGGSSSVLVQTSFFHNAGRRVVSIGGASRPVDFRPPDATCEATDITVAGNRFVGGEAHVAWVTARGGHVHHNIFYMPDKWVGRILQETNNARFPPCHGGVFEYNMAVIGRRAGVRVMVNQGRGIDSARFAFRGNAWLRLDTEDRPVLPTAEVDGVYQIDPKLADRGTPEMRIMSNEAGLAHVGPRSYTPWRLGEDFQDVTPPRAPIADGGTGETERAGLYVAAVLGAVVLGLVAVWFMRRRRPRLGWGTRVQTIRRAPRQVRNRTRR